MRTKTGIIMAALMVCGAAGTAEAVETVRNDHYVPSLTDTGITIHIAEKYPATSAPDRMGKAVLFVHGATYPGTSFDLPVPGYNWMDYVVGHGFAAYYVDIRGYGESTRPPEMDEPPSANAPIVRTPTAVRDIAVAVNFIRARAAVDKVSLVGWSWGTVTTGMYTANNNALVDRLVLYAPVYDYEHPVNRPRLADPDDPNRLNPDLGAYRLVSAEAARKRWEAQIVPENKDEWREPGIFEVWYDAILATDPKSGEYDPPQLRAPNGVLVDVFSIYSGRPVYDASQIGVPTLIIRGAADPTATDADAQGLLARLGTDHKRYVQIANGTHFISLEKTAPQLFREVQTFLNE